MRNTPSHPELDSEKPSRRWYFVLRRGRVGRCQLFFSLNTRSWRVFLFIATSFPSFFPFFLIFHKNNLTIFFHKTYFSFYIQCHVGIQSQDQKKILLYLQMYLGGNQQIYFQFPAISITKNTLFLI